MTTRCIFRHILLLLLLVAVHGQSATSVLEHGADPTGKNDSTAAFRSALLNNTTTVHVPYGNYRITGAINLTQQTLQGAVAASWSSDVQPAPHITFDMSAKTAFAHLHSGASIHGLSISYDWKGSQPSAVPPCLHIAADVGRATSGARITDMRISGAWDAVSSLGTGNAGRFYIANIFINDCHHYGMALGEAYDLSVLDNVEVWAPTSVSFFESGVGLLLYGIDGLRASNLGIFRAATAIQVVDQVPGQRKHPMWVTFSNVITDYCKQAMVINGSNTVSLTSGSFQSHENSLRVSGDGTTRIGASRFKSNGDVAVIIEGNGTFTMAGSGITRNFPPVKDVPALRIGGDVRQMTLITGCDISCSDPTAVQVDPGASESVQMQANFVRTNATSATAWASPGFDTHHKGVPK